MKSTTLDLIYFDRVNSIKKLREFALELEKNHSNDVFQNISTLKKLVEEDFINDLLNYELTNLNANNLYFPEKSSFNYLTILKNNYCSLSIINIPKNNLKTNTISALSKDTVILSLTKQPIIYNLFIQDNPYPIDILDKTKKLKLIEENKVLEFGETIKLRKHQDILVYNESFNSDILILQLQSRIESSIFWEYSIDCFPCSIASENEEPNRLENLCKIFAEIGNRASIKSLKMLLQNEHFNVRWAAAKALMLLDTNEGINALNILTEDENEEVKEVSKKHLNYIKTMLNKN